MIKRAVVTILGLLNISGAIWIAFHPYNLPQPDFYNNLQTVVSFMFTFLAGVAAIVTGIFHK